MTNKEVLSKAKEFTANVLKDNNPNISASDIYIVWFAKTLQNWKALCSTDKLHEFYVEVTYNGDKKEAYADVYVKTKNLAIQVEPTPKVVIGSSALH